MFLSGGRLVIESMEKTKMLPIQSLERRMNVYNFWVGFPLSCWARPASVGSVFLEFQINGRRCGDVIMSHSYKENSKQTTSLALMSAATKGQRTKTRTHFMIHGERNKVEKNPQFVFSPVRLRAAEEWPPYRRWCKEVVCLSQKEQLYSSHPESCASGPI